MRPLIFVAGGPQTGKGTALVYRYGRNHGTSVRCEVREERDCCFNVLAKVEQVVGVQQLRRLAVKEATDGHNFGVHLSIVVGEIICRLVAALMEHGSAFGDVVLGAVPPGASLGVTAAARFVPDGEPFASSIVKQNPVNFETDFWRDSEKIRLGLVRHVVDVKLFGLFPAFSNEIFCAKLVRSILLSTGQGDTTKKEKEKEERNRVCPLERKGISKPPRRESGLPRESEGAVAEMLWLIMARKGFHQGSSDLVAHEDIHACDANHFTSLNVVFLLPGFMAAIFHQGTHRYTF